MRPFMAFPPSFCALPLPVARPPENRGAVGRPWQTRRGPAGLGGGDDAPWGGDCHTAQRVSSSPLGDTPGDSGGPPGRR